MEDRQPTGGQTGETSWEIADWRTGELIESGTGGYEACDAAARRLDPKDTWLDIDNVPGGDISEVEPQGVPASLAEALQDWLGMSSTPDEDVVVVVRPGRPPRAVPTLPEQPEALVQLLDWRHGPHFWPAAPCVLCGTTTPLRSHAKEPVHKACAELWNS
ncbi:hypothetical protein E2C00_00645 [Streptomyces sp. WAC05374]|uniref:hypothetical protein n=1 Tax=Streptomyces sp. WAC05374 TaxID=2487420 RepID=UPI000F88097D|nr:hypothetical protein [Streptomyces sp. WAC05374]RST19588.1 hypothetical protein EF905_00300 [Streptomyces sp. WAC05374]TDF50075.1 hypothetical protein E2B92_00620 [Streptomyces sp. WAC05374]TDF57801.1 hypothetical protein E2C02_08410 [Streptomyces sp. WAC05374]TDF60329.1 hypothetical protein E2C00_00645 [Streptomyces sp. WAC05374]